MSMAAKPWAPRISFFVLFMAAMSLDFLFMALAFARAGDPASWSHGLFMSVVWSILTGFAVAWVCRDYRAGLVLGSVVFSHWILDWISHPIPFSTFSWRTWRWDYGHHLPPDLPLFFAGSPKVALGLYDHISAVAATILEVSMFIVGTAVYLRYRAKADVPGLTEDRSGY